MKKIAIHSVPRSGSSWVGQIFNSAPCVAFRFQPLFSYAFKDYLDPSSAQEEIDTFFKEILKSDDAFLLQQEKVDAGIYPNFNKSKILTHVVYKEVRYHHILKNLLQQDPNILVIGIVRNPYAVISSFLKAPREFRKDLRWNELEEWRYAPSKNLDKPEEFNGYEKWKEVTLLFQDLKRHYPDRFYLVRYDNLLENSIEEVKKIFRFCAISMSQQTVDFLTKSQSVDHNDTYSVYKKKTLDDGWKKSLHPTIVSAITEDLKQSSMKEFLPE
jgi:hypothetical protein